MENKKRSVSTKTFAILLAVMLIIGCVAGGTIAWLTAQTEAKVNTFTYGDVNITLNETTTDYKIYPGAEISKDPKVTVTANSENCWLFVKIEKSDDFIKAKASYDIATGWTPLTDVENVYYREVAAEDTDQAFYVLKDNKVMIDSALTKTEIEALKNKGTTTLTFTAYAVQKAGNATAAEAWEKIA